MSETSEYTRKITVTFETEDAAHELFAYLCAKWDGVEISENRVIVTDWINIVEDIWYAMCEVEVSDKCSLIQIQKITEA